MTFRFKPSPSRLASIWLGEAPGAAYEPRSNLDRKLDGADVVIRERRLLAIELVVQAGPRSLYGLLGAQLIPKDELEFVINVSTATDDGPRFVSSISPNFEDVRIGLPSEYGAAVLKGALEATNGVESLPFAKLNFSYAAHSQVGSSNAVFEYLGRIVAKVLLSKEELVSEQELAELLAMPINS